MASTDPSVSTGARPPSVAVTADPSSRPPSPRPALTPRLSSASHPLQVTDLISHFEALRAANSLPVPALAPASPARTRSPSPTNTASPARPDSDLEEGEIPQSTPATSPLPTGSAAKLAQPNKATAATSAAKGAGADAPLATILQRMDTLPARDRAAVVRTVSRLGGGDPSASRRLPLTQAWTLHFSDTSATKPASAAHHQATAKSYSNAMVELFVARDVPTLCGALKALRRRMAEKIPTRGGPGGGVGMGGETDTVEGVGAGLGVGRLRPGQNLHFFREDVKPVWEDEWNSKGGRITISPPPALIDPLFLALVLIIAGDLLPTHVPAPTPSKSSASVPPTPSASVPASPGAITDGCVLGVVASRRARGDRIEVWLSGPKKASPVPPDWVDRLKEAICEGINGPSVDGDAEGETPGADGEKKKVKGRGVEDVEKELVNWVRQAKYKRHLA